MSTSKEQFVHGVFNQIAGIYDPMNLVLTFGLFRHWQHVLYKQVRVTPGSEVLDLACGTGDLTKEWARRVGPSGHVVGLDLSEKMLEVAKKKLDQAGFSGRTDLVLGKAEELPFPDASFDLVTIGFALRNVSDLDRTLSEMRRVLRPGGYVFSLELSHPTQPMFSALYKFYFYRVVPWMGLLARKGRSPYAWLSESLKTFPDAPRLSEKFGEAGFSAVKAMPLTWGVVAIHQGVVRSENEKVK